ncbi:MAG: aspartate-semialdehyde dehydrogenase [Syntrophomonadaceae bacterium]|nr:aspartate-semialdehyde dehydrogenase [Syntrophomonadaceae bacterium]MDD3888298.1 aspartate-semialdehyde dehydrogenase [Syntrophomonadaceae bacterium]MDD4548805.1 aspartate-semialdehyde dehydrogenase [Syntrophomonadaceae bacterium]
MAGEVKLAIVGATGAVGQEMLKILEERHFQLKELICLADPREAGKKINFRGEELTVRGANEAAFKEADIALFAVGNDISKQLAPLAKKNNCLVIDNSNAFRLDKEVPLVVPEVNAEDIRSHKGIIANPNCSTTIMVVAINPIYQAAGLKRVVVSTYQAVSGAGKAGFEELDEHTKAHFEGKEVTPKVFQYPIAFNVIPHIDVFEENGYTREEMKMVLETQKIFHNPGLKIAATTVRVPVYRSHSESINLETEKPLTAEEARKILAQSPGVIVEDDPSSNLYPMPLYASNKDEVYVGRIRKDISADNGIVLWVASDQIRKGAATNAIQIAEKVVSENLY